MKCDFFVCLSQSYFVLVDIKFYVSLLNKEVKLFM